jgi:hypothetical protein
MFTTRRVILSEGRAFAAAVEGPAFAFAVAFPRTLAILRDFPNTKSYFC